MLLKHVLILPPLVFALRYNGEIKDEIPLPVKRGVITSNFGDRRSTLSKCTHFHAGVDIGAALGDPVFSIGAGQVVFTGNYLGYGNLVVVKHGAEISTHYAHLSEIKAHVGDFVTSQTELGTIGMTGHATGTHLHFEVRKHGHPTDPLTVILSLNNLKRRQQ